MSWAWLFWQAIYLLLSFAFLVAAFAWLTLLQIFFRADSFSWKSTLFNAFLLFLIVFAINQVFPFFPVSIHVSPLVFVPETNDLLSPSLREQLFLPGIPYPGIILTLPISFEKYISMLNVISSLALTVGLMFIAIYRWKLPRRSLAILLLLSSLGLIYFLTKFY